MTLLAAYGFGAGSGSTVADDSGNGHTLTLGSATWTASGHTGPALTNSTASSAGATATVPAVTGTAVSLMAWVKPLDLTAGTAHFVCGVVQAGGSTDIGLFTERGDFGSPNVGQANVRISGGLVAANGTALTVGTWTHLAATFDGTNIRFYINATLAATVANTGSVSIGTGFYVAGAPTSAALKSDVVVDDVRYYNEVLDAPAITTAMNTPVGGSATSADTALTATATITGSVQTTKPASAGTAATAGVIATAATTKPASAGLAATAGIAGTATAGRPAGSTLTATATITAGATVGSPANGDATVAALATIAATAIVTKSIGATLVGDATIAATVGSGDGGAFLCQDFAGTVAVDTYSGAVAVQSYSGTAKAVSYGGTVHVESYGGTTENCGR